MFPTDIFQSLFNLKFVSRHLCTYFLPGYSHSCLLSLVSTTACIPRSTPGVNHLKPVYDYLNYSGNKERSRAFSPLFTPSLMRKPSPACAGSLLSSLRQYIARQYIFIKAEARLCSRELGFNVIYEEPLPREIIEPPV